MAHIQAVNWRGLYDKWPEQRTALGNFRTAPDLQSFVDLGVPDPDDPDLLSYDADPIFVTGAARVVSSAPVTDAPADRTIVRLVLISAGQGVPGGSRDGKIIEVPGMNFEHWDRTGTWLKAHNWEDFPIGVGVYREVAKRGDLYEVAVEVEFPPKDIHEEGWRAGQLHRIGMMRMCSIGWATHEARIVRDKRGNIVASIQVRTEMLEGSSCGVGIDRGAVQEAIRSGVASEQQIEEIMGEAPQRSGVYDLGGYDVEDRAAGDGERVVIERVDLVNPFREGGVVGEMKGKGRSMSGKRELGRKAIVWARAAIIEGDFDAESDWDFDADDAGALNQDQRGLGSFFLGREPEVEDHKRAHFVYPFVKLDGDGKAIVYRSALRAMRTMAASRGENEIADAADKVIEMLDAQAAEQRARPPIKVMPPKGSSTPKPASRARPPIKTMPPKGGAQPKPTAARAAGDDEKKSAVPDGMTVASITLSKERFATIDEARAWLKRNKFKVGDGHDELESGWRFTLRGGDDFDGDTFETISLDKGVKARVGKLGGKKADDDGRALVDFDFRGPVGKAMDSANDTLQAGVMVLNQVSAELWALTGGYYATGRGVDEAVIVRAVSEYEQRLRELCARADLIDVLTAAEEPAEPAPEDFESQIDRHLSRAESARERIGTGLDEFRDAFLLVGDDELAPEGREAGDERGARVGKVLNRQNVGRLRSILKLVAEQRGITGAMRKALDEVLAHVDDGRSAEPGDDESTVDFEARLRALETATVEKAHGPQLGALEARLADAEQRSTAEAEPASTPEPEPETKAAASSNGLAPGKRSAQYPNLRLPSS